MALSTEEPNDIFTEKELEVAEILCQLPYLFQEVKPRPFITWGRKKKRSSNGEKIDIKVQASSPDTPLSFSPSESDLKHKRPRRRDFKKKTNKELKQKVEELLVQQRELKYEISKVTEYCNKLIVLNVALKARKRKMESGFLQTGYQHQIDLNSCKSLNLFEKPTSEPYLAFEEKQPSPTTKHPLLYSAIHPKEGMVMENSQLRCGETFLSSASGVGLGLENRIRHVGIFDRNFPYANEEAVSLDFQHHSYHLKSKAAVAAQARKRRIEIIRGKSCLAFKQPRFR